MALGYNWEQVSYWEWIPGTGFKIAFITEAKLERQDINNNKSYVNTRLRSVIKSGAGSGHNYYFHVTGATAKSGSNLWTFATEDIVYGTYEINHQANGTASTQVTTTVQCTGAGLSNTSYRSEWFALPTIPRAATINTFTGNDIEESFSVTYTKKNSSFNHKLRISIPNVVAIQTTDYNTSGTSFTLSNEAKETVYNYAYDNDLENVSLGAVIETYNGGTKIGESAELINSCEVGGATRIMINNAYTRATSYININGTYKRAIPYIRVNNEWKRGK